MKEHLKGLPTITRPETGDILQLYVSASPKTIATVLLVERRKGNAPYTSSVTFLTAQKAAISWWKKWPWQSS